MPFKQMLKTEEQVRELVGYPRETIERKTIHYLDHHCQDFIQLSPFVLLATSDENGTCDVSPRGDMAGFVQILDEKRLVIPERPGNRKIDSIRNILANPQAGLIFLIPGLEETLRVNGKAYIIADQELLETMAVKGKVPKLAIGMEVKECFIHCAKALKRSQLWEPRSWPNASDLPSPAKILSSHINDPRHDEEAIQRALEESYRERLY